MPKFINRRINAFKRRVNSRPFKLAIVAGLLFVGTASYAYYMSNQRLSVNPETYKPLLNVIAKAESSGNYNAYFGNSRNAEIDFTNMTIAEVKKWQKDYVKQGSPSSAVGRYQIISTTLDSLVEEQGIDPEQKFDEETQDKMAVALLERRGAESYVNEELTKEEFAASLAKEWAGLPKVVGENPEQSYYAGDGLNKSRVEPEKVLEAIEPISPL